MKDEIKEILDKCTPFLFGDEVDKLVDYITNLEKENERLEKQVSEYQDEIFARDNNWYDMQD